MLKIDKVLTLFVDAYNERHAARAWEDRDDIEWDAIEYIFAWDKDSFTLHGREISKQEFDTGGEGHAEEVYMVFKTVDVDGAVQYWRKDGYYASYDGGDWDGDFKEVNAVERVVTFYE